MNTEECLVVLALVVHTGCYSPQPSPLEETPEQRAQALTVTCRPKRILAVYVYPKDIPFVTGSTAVSDYVENNFRDICGESALRISGSDHGQNGEPWQNPCFSTNPGPSPASFPWATDFAAPGIAPYIRDHTTAFRAVNNSDQTSCLNFPGWDTRVPGGITRRYITVMNIDAATLRNAPSTENVLSWGEQWYEYWRSGIGGELLHQYRRDYNWHRALISRRLGGNTWWTAFESSQVRTHSDTAGPAACVTRNSSYPNNYSWQTDIFYPQAYFITCTSSTHPRDAMRIPPGTLPNTLEQSANSAETLDSYLRQLGMPAEHSNVEPTTNYRLDNLASPHQ